MMTSTQYGQLVTTTPVFQKSPVVTISSTAHQHMVTSAFQQPVTMTSTQYGQLVATTPVFQQPPTLTTSTTTY